ncbi:MAG TPA: DUF3280 domain-containing protein [Steroidobacteraceae bacterium]|nr:DUF3280 domain-containing protein [Steroidobacteraceae bacterium]
MALRSHGWWVTHRAGAGFGSLAIVALGLILPPLVGAEGVPAPQVKIAVFDFELEDLSPSAVLLNKSANRTAIMDRVTSAARRELAESGRYSVIDASKADAPAVASKSLRNCDGCEAAIARKLGADQSLIGIVRSVTQTDYYVAIQIRDARTGKLIDQQEANFAGGEEGWPSGVRMLLKHQILVAPN